MNKIKLKIGEFSKLCYVTVKTLRHYEKLGLLVPNNVDEWTHYRYYDVSQMEKMAQIKTLKALGLGLGEIKTLFDSELSVPNDALVEQKIAETQSQICTLKKRLHALQSLQKPTKKTQQMKEIVIKPLPEGVVASWRSHLKSYDDLGEKLVTIVMPEMQRLGCVCPQETAYCFTVDHNSNHNPDDIDLEYCEIVEKQLVDSELIKFKTLPVVPTAVCINHHGGYDTFGETMAAVFRFIEEKQYQISEQPRFCYIHGIWDCDSVEDWLTEVQIPVKIG